LVHGAVLPGKDRGSGGVPHILIFSLRSSAIAMRSRDFRPNDYEAAGFNPQMLVY